MEKKVKRLGFLKWLSIPLGFIMFALTFDSFGTFISSLFSAMAIVAFWNVVKNEQTRLIGQTIADEIKKAISEAGNIDNMIEIKRMKSGIIARVYLINARERAQIVHRFIANRMEHCTFKKYLWIMQLTDMHGKGALRETQKILNEQLLEELSKKRRKNQQNK